MSELDDSELKPSIYVEELTFSDGSSIQLEKNDIVVFVGPNNAGKSAALREIQAFITNHAPQQVIRSARMVRSGSGDGLAKYLREHAQRIGDPGNVHFAGLGFSIQEANLRHIDQANGWPQIAPFFSMRLPTEQRIVGSNSAQAIQLHRQAPSHPIHLLLADEQLAGRIGVLFKRAFGEDLFPLRAGGSHFPLQVGKKPQISVGKDELSREFVELVMAETTMLEQQGDGMRSFVTILLYALVADHHSILLLDEPEAFLHPPQARLIGEFIASERRSNSQLFIATHSADVLEGLISQGSANLRIIRIQRDRNVNRVKELSKQRILNIVHDTLTRYSRVFEGIFYKHVFVCESDSDCMFYNALLNTKAISEDRRPDVHFVHAAGKTRLGKLTSLLHEMNVPVSIVADIDILNDESSFKSAFEALGGEWAAIESDFKALAGEISAMAPPKSGKDIKDEIYAALSTVPSSGAFPKTVDLKIKDILKARSPWDNVKRAGRNALPKGQTISRYDRLASQCASIGLWIVPVGELEGFCPTIEGHGPSFVAKVLQERNLESDAELEVARRFVGDIWKTARLLS